MISGSSRGSRGGVYHSPVSPNEFLTDLKRVWNSSADFEHDTESMLLKNSLNLHKPKSLIWLPTDRIWRHWIGGLGLGCAFWSGAWLLWGVASTEPGIRLFPEQLWLRILRAWNSYSDFHGMNHAFYHAIPGICEVPKNKLSKRFLSLNFQKCNLGRWFSVTKPQECSDCKVLLGIQGPAVAVTISLASKYWWHPTREPRELVFGKKEVHKTEKARFWICQLWTFLTQHNGTHELHSSWLEVVSCASSLQQGWARPRTRAARGWTSHQLSFSLFRVD